MTDCHIFSYIYNILPQYFSVTPLHISDKTSGHCSSDRVATEPDVLGQTTMIRTLTKWILWQNLTRAQEQSCDKREI